MKYLLTCKSLLMIAALALVTPPSARLVAADTTTDSIDAVRGAYSVDRKAFVAEKMQLSESESAAFWPLYDQYRAGREKLGDGLLKLVLEYADMYPDVPEARGRELLKGYTALEKKLADQRASYLKKFARILPASKALRFAQVENRLDLALRLQLASAIPLTPIEGKLTGQVTGAAVLAQGVPGGAVVRTYELTARVASIDTATRKVTLVSSDGIKKTVKMGPEVINFDQIHVGDQLKVMAAEELVVYVAGEGEASGDATAQFVALAPEGAKPGGMMAETTQVTAKVTAIDIGHRKATLEFEDGSTQTVAVRPDVDLGKRKVGDQVVIRITEALAIEVKESRRQ
jgi:hypothetical protein